MGRRFAQSIVSFMLFVEAGSDDVDDAKVRMLDEAHEWRVCITRQNVVAEALLHEINAVQLVALVVDVLVR